MELKKITNPSHNIEKALSNHQNKIAKIRQQNAKHMQFRSTILKARRDEMEYICLEPRVGKKEQYIRSNDKWNERNLLANHKLKMWKWQNNKFKKKLHKNPLHFLENPQDMVDRQKNFDKASTILVDHFERIVKITEQHWPYFQQRPEEKLHQDELSTNKEGTECFKSNPTQSNELDGKDAIVSDFNENEIQEHETSGLSPVCFLNVLDILVDKQKLKRDVVEILDKSIKDPYPSCSMDLDNWKLSLDKILNEMEEISQLIHIVNTTFKIWHQRKEKENQENEIKGGMDEKSYDDLPVVKFSCHSHQIKECVKTVHDHLSHNTGKFSSSFMRENCCLSHQ